MGQAKQRGTLEQRRSVAIERGAEIAKLRAAYEATRPKQRVSVTTTLTLCLLASLDQERSGA